MIKKGVSHLDQNEFVGENERGRENIEKEKEKIKKREGKMGGKEIQLLLVSNIRTTRLSMGQKVS